MKIRPVLWIMAVAALMLLASVSALGTQASGPEGAPYLDDGSHTVAAGSDAWYKFEFALTQPGFLCKFIFCPDKPSNHGYVQINMPGQAKSGLQFAVYAPGQMRRWQMEDPVGMGSPIDDDLTWASDIDDNAKPWYVRVINDTNGPLRYQFDVQGIGLVLSRPVVPTERPLSPSEQWEQSQRPVPTPTPNYTTANTDPSKAVATDGYAHTIPAQSELWYRFEFPNGLHSIITLADAARNGLSLEVYAPDQLNTWWKGDPLGRGDVVGADLVWAGDPDGGTVRYLRVVNRTNADVSFRFGINTPALPKPGPLPFSNLP